MNCVFCKINKGTIPSKTIYETETLKVILDIDPISPGHMMIIPKEHFTDLKDIRQDVLNEINALAKEMIRLLENKLNCQGVTLMQNNGRGQEVKHYHLHLIPRYDNDSLYIGSENQESSSIDDTFARLIS